MQEIIVPEWAGKIQLSLYQNCRSRHKSNDLSKEQFINAVREGSIDGWKFGATIDALRGVVTEDGHAKEKDIKVNAFKQSLPAVTISATTTGERKLNALSVHTGLLQIDLDAKDNPALLDDLGGVRNALEKDQHTLLLFLSPSGNGLKIIVRIPDSIDLHGSAFTQARAYYYDKYGLRMDKQTSDPTRLCYLSLDPQIFINWEATAFYQAPADIPFEPGTDRTVLKTTSILSSHGRNRERTLEDIQRMVLQIEAKRLDITGNNTDWFSLGCSLASYLGEEARTIFHRISVFYPGYSTEECNAMFDRCLKIGNSPIEFFYSACKRFGILAKETAHIRNGDTPVKASSPMAKVDVLALYHVKSRNKEGKVKELEILRKPFFALLHQMGFYRYELNGNLIFVNLIDNILQEVSAVHIQTTFLKWLSLAPAKLGEFSRAFLEEKFMAIRERFFSLGHFTLLEELKPKFCRDAKDAHYFFFRNGFVIVKKDGYFLNPYAALPGHIWNSQIIPHDFFMESITTDDWEITKAGVFAQYLYNVSKGNENDAAHQQERFHAFCTLLGYLLHHHFESETRAIILTESRMGTGSNGGSGKGVFTQALEKLKPTARVHGKSFKPDNQFRFQNVEQEHQIVCIDDAQKNFPLESLYNDITEGVRVEKKQRDPFYIKTKILITTNHTIRTDGGSDRRRVLEAEFGDHYSEHFSPADDFQGKWFFSQDEERWTNEDWNQFYHFAFHCCMLYHQCGLLKPAEVNLGSRKLEDETHPDFVEWMNEKIETGTIQSEIWYDKKELWEEFRRKYPELERMECFQNQKRFTESIIRFKNYTPSIKDHSKADEKKNNAKRYIQFVLQ